jgi:hypothetical protein
MPEHLRALVVILVLAAVVFAFAKAPACAAASTAGDFERRRNLWFALTLTAFLAHNFWIYMIIAAVVLLSALRSEQNKLAMFFFLLFAIPAIFAEIPAFGVVNFLFAIDYVRLLVLMLLLPAFLTLRRRTDVEPFGRSVCDKLIAGYLLLSIVLMLEYDSFTNVLRKGIFDPFIDTFLPYYVASRYPRNLQAFRDCLMSLAIGALVLSATLVFEVLRKWLLYGSLDQALGVEWGWLSFQTRGSNLRAAGTAGHPIAAGYVMAVAIGLFLYLRTLVPNPLARKLGLLLLAAGLIAALSRGPWLGAAAMVLILAATDRAPGLALAKLGLLGVIALLLVLVSPAGQTIIDHLPWVGTIEAESVAFRERLAIATVEVFLENPILGRYDYLASPALEVLRQGGLIDMVNTYAIVTLGSGLVGLSLFVGFFGSVLFGIYKGMRNLADRNDERYLLGRALLATLLGILFIIGTMSPLSVVSVIYWSVAGFGVAYARMLVVEKAQGATRPERSPPAAARRFT